MVELSDNQKVQPTFLILLTGWTIWLSESSTLRKCIFGYWLGLNFLIIKKFKSSVWTFWLSESSTMCGWTFWGWTFWLHPTYWHTDILTCWHTDMMFSDIVLTFWTTFILITKLKNCILTYWHIDIVTCWHIDIRTYWHTEILFSDILLTFWTTFLLITKLRIDLKFWPYHSYWGGHQDYGQPKTVFQVQWPVIQILSQWWPLFHLQWLGLILHLLQWVEFRLLENMSCDNIVCPSW